MDTRDPNWVPGAEQEIAPGFYLIQLSEILAYGSAREAVLQSRRTPIIDVAFVDASDREPDALFSSTNYIGGLRHWALFYIGTNDA